MTDLYPEIEAYEHGYIEVGNGNSIYWETCGNPDGKPVVVLHGGPGSGCTPWNRRLFNPGAYRIVLFDQRNCGRSKPCASALDTDLTNNTTAHLISDIEQLRAYLRIERWMIFGGSWGSTLSLAYAVNYPERVNGIILFGVTTGRHNEVDWLFRGGVSIFFPEQWDRLCRALPATERNGDILAAYYRQLNDSDLAVRQQAANAWCLWESATLRWPPTTQLSPRFRDPVYALAFARIVTHYTHHNLFLEDGILLRQADKLADIPGIMINGRYDFQAPIGYAWELKRVWPRAELVIVDNAGHAADSANLMQEFIRATDRFATFQ